jgi:hypothetical protein
MTVVAMCSAAIALFLIGIIAAKNEIAEARGLEKIVALSHLCFAIPLAVFGALHLFGPQFVVALVPRYMPWRPFWVYFIGCALIAASLSIATRTAVRWSGLLVGIMMLPWQTFRLVVTPRCQTPGRPLDAPRTRSPMCRHGPAKSAS